MGWPLLGILSLSVSLFVVATSIAVSSPVEPQPSLPVPPAATAEPVVVAPAPDSQAAPVAASASPEAPADASADAPADTPADIGAIVVTARGKPPPTDPLQGINLKAFDAVQSVDRAVVGPISMTYAARVPGPIRAGVHNVLVLLDEPTVFVNFLLQHRIGKAVETLGRIAINATFGLGGLFDVAKRPPFNLPHRVNGFGYTMGFYGVHQGPYLFVPLIGSTTARDLVGRLMDLSLLSVAVGGPFSSRYYGPVRGTLASIDDRVQFDAELRRLRDESPDGYDSLRDYYLTKRQAEIDALHGKRAAAPVIVPAPSVAPVPAPAGTAD